jgi:hypothetical protein
MRDSPDLAFPGLQGDDVASLKRHLPKGEFDYVDVVAERAHQEALGRWPLLAETHDCATRAEAEVAPGQDARAGNAQGEPI